MIKKFFELTGDFILATLLLGIVMTSIITVMSLSPIGLETSLSENNVLGEQSDKKLSEALIILENVNEHEYFKVDTTTFPEFKQQIHLGPISANRYSKSVFTIENISNFDKHYQIVMDIPDDYLLFADYGMITDSEIYVLHYAGNDANNVINGQIEAGSKIEYKIDIDPIQNINFPLDITLYVKEVK